MINLTAIHHTNNLNLRPNDVTIHKRTALLHYVHGGDEGVILRMRLPCIVTLPPTIPIMVTAAAATADLSTTANTTVADSTVMASANAFKLATSNISAFFFHRRPGSLWGRGGRRTGILNLNLDAERVTMHAHNAWALSRGTALLDEGTLVTLPGHCS